MALQFIAYAFYPLVDFPWEANLIKVLRAIAIHTSRFPMSENGSEHIYFAFAFMGFFICVNVLAAFSATLLRWDWPVQLARVCLKAYRTILFVPIVRALTQALFGCSRESGAHPFLPGYTCGDNTHIILAAVSCIFLILFMLFISLAAGCMYDTDGNPRSRTASIDCKSDGWDSIYFHFTHLIFLIVFAGAHNHASRYYLAVLLFVVGVGLAAYQVYVLPYYNDMYQAAIIFAYFLLAWTGVGSFAATLLPNTSGTAVILFCGFPVLLIASVLAVRSRYSYVESLRDMDLTSPLLFELRARIISQGLRDTSGLYFDETQESEDVAKRIRSDCEHLLQLGIERFPNDARLHLVFTTFFLYIIDNKVLAYSELQAVESCEPAWDVHFFVQHFRYVLDLATIASQSREVQSYLEFKTRKEVADDCVRTGAKSIFEFWSELLRSAPDINMLSQLGHMSRTAMTKASYNYDKLLEINPNSVPVLRSYGVFVLDLMGDVPRASVLFKRAEDVEKQRKKSQNMNMQRGNFLQHMESNLDIFDERNAVFGVIVDRRRIGIIESVNFAGRKLFGYPQTSDMVGQNISMTIPRPLSDVHDELLIDFLNRGTSRILNTTRVAFALHKNGHIFPINLYIRWADQGNGKMVGVIQPIEVKRDVHLIIDRETNVIQYATTSCYEFFGVTKDQVANKLLKLWDLLPMLNDKEDIDLTDRCWEQIVMRSGLTCIGFNQSSGEHFGVQAWILDVQVGGRDATFVKIHVFNADTDSDEEEESYIFGGEYDSDDEDDTQNDNESMTSSMSGSMASGSYYSNSLPSRSSMSSNSQAQQVLQQQQSILQQQQLAEEDEEDEFHDAHMHLYGRKPGQLLSAIDTFDVLPPLHEEGEAEDEDEDEEDEQMQGKEIMHDANGRAIAWAAPKAATESISDDNMSVSRSSMISDGSKRSLSDVLEDLKRKKRQNRRRKRALGLETSESVVTEATTTVSQQNALAAAKQNQQFMEMAAILLNKRGYKKLMRVIAQENSHTSRWLRRLSRFFLLLLVGVCALSIALYAVITDYLHYSHEQLHRVVAGMEREAIIQDNINHIRLSTMITPDSVAMLARTSAFPIATEAEMHKEIIDRVKTSDARFRTLTNIVNDRNSHSKLRTLLTEDVIPMHVMISGEVSFDYMGLLEALESFVAMSFEAVTIDPALLDINNNHAAYFTISNGLRQIPEVLDLASTYMQEVLADSNTKAMWISIAITLVAAALIIFVFMVFVRPIVMHIERGKARVLVMFMNIPKNVRRMLRRRAYLAMKDETEVNESEPEIVFNEDDENKSMTSTLRDTQSTATSRAASALLEDRLGVTQRYNLYMNDKIRQHLQEDSTALAKEIELQRQNASKKLSEGLPDSPGQSPKVDKSTVKANAEDEHNADNTVDQHVSRYNIMVIFSKYAFFFCFVVLYFIIVAYYTTVRLDDVTESAKLASYTSQRLSTLQRSFFGLREHLFAYYDDVIANHPSNPTTVLGPFADMSRKFVENTRMLHSTALYGSPALGVSAAPYYAPYADTLFGNACTLPFDASMASAYFQQSCPVYWEGVMLYGAHYALGRVLEAIESMRQSVFGGIFAHMLGGPAHPTYAPDSPTYVSLKRQFMAIDPVVNDLLSYPLRLSPYMLWQQGKSYIQGFDTFRIVFLLCFLASLLVLYILVYSPIVHYLNISARQTRAMILVLSPSVMQVCSSVVSFREELSDE